MDWFGICLCRCPCVCVHSLILSDILFHFVRIKGLCKGLRAYSPTIGSIMFFQGRENAFLNAGKSVKNRVTFFLILAPIEELFYLIFFIQHYTHFMSYTSVTIYCHVIKRAILLCLRSGLIGSSGIRTRDLSVSSLTRCHLSYSASVNRVNF